MEWGRLCELMAFYIVHATLGIIYIFFTFSEELIFSVHKVATAVAAKQNLCSRNMKNKDQNK